MEKQDKKNKIKKNMTFSELFEIKPKASEKLAEQGLFCAACPMAQMETIEQGCDAHGLDVDKVIKELNKL